MKTTRPKGIPSTKSVPIAARRSSPPSPLNLSSSLKHPSYSALSHSTPISPHDRGFDIDSHIKQRLNSSSLADPKDSSINISRANSSMERTNSFTLEVRNSLSSHRDSLSQLLSNIPGREASPVNEKHHKSSRLNLNLTIHRFPLAFVDSALEENYRQFSLQNWLLKVRTSFAFLVVIFVLLSLKTALDRVLPLVWVFSVVGVAVFLILYALFLWRSYKNAPLNPQNICFLHVWVTGVAITTLTNVHVRDASDAVYAVYSIGYLLISFFTVPVQSLHTLITALCVFLISAVFSLLNQNLGNLWQLYTVILAAIPMAYMKEYTKREEYIRIYTTHMSEKALRHTTEELNKAKRNFMQYIFHEIRVPLNAVLLAIGEFLEENLSPHMKELANLMNSQVHIVVRILDDVLSMQKIEKGQMVLEKTWFDIEKLVKELVHVYCSLSQKKKYLVQVNLSDTNSTVFGDKYRIQQIIGNFISNALKFLPPPPAKGKISITVRPLSLEPPENFPPAPDTNEETLLQWIEVSVTDNGVGITAEDQNKLFQKYVQISSGELQQGRGTGLGLSICKNLVSLHQGVIGVKSIPGRGTRFYFKIPFYCKEQTYIKKAMKKELLHRISSGTPMKRARTKDLVVNIEDSAPSRRLLTRIIEKMNFKVMEFSNGKEAVDYFAEHVNDAEFRARLLLLIIDKEMPRMWFLNTINMW